MRRNKFKKDISESTQKNKRNKTAVTSLTVTSRRHSSKAVLEFYDELVQI